ncbi:MAG: four helix bundle protein [Thermodesulfobacteriota bacterium]
MTYARFEEVPVWQDALRLAEGVYDLTEKCGWPGSRSLRDQIERAALSVSNNIAEGFERGTTKELLAFLYIARGSAGEVRSMLCFIERRYGDLRFEMSDLKSKTTAQKPNSFDSRFSAPQSRLPNPKSQESIPLKSQISNLKSLAESCSRQLRAWADHLQNSDIAGQRHLNKKTKSRYFANKEAEAFEKELLDHLPPEHPLRKFKMEREKE